MCVCVCVCVCARACACVCACACQRADLLARFKNRLTVLSGELKACSKRPGEALVKAARIFVDAIQRHVEGEGV